jgi:hypothetical protein
VVNVTVDQSTNLVVDPASLSIPANGADSFKVKLAKDPTKPVTVTVKTSTPDLTTTPASLAFAPGTFDINQTVLVSTGLGAVPGAQSVLLDAGPLGQFKLPVTITPASKTIFFIDPTPGGIGNDNSPGTAAQPWQTVWKVLDSAQPTGLKVATAASAGNDVVVTILGGTNNQGGVTSNITTPALSAGSVTVLQAPSPKMFTLNLGSQSLTLDKGYKLQDINIISTVASGTAVLIKHPTAGLASVDVDCSGSGTSVRCVKVEGPGFDTLKDVTVKVAANSSNIGILNNDASVSLTIVGGEVRLVGNSSKITLIQSNGVLIATGLTVDMTGGGSHTKDSTGIVLNAAGSFITGSTIKINKAANNNTDAIGIDVQHTTGKSTVEGNTFIGFNVAGTNGNLIGVNGSNSLSSNALLKNTFKGFFTTPVQ